MNNEEWKSINDYEGLYEINSAGTVRSLYKRNYHKVILPRTDRAGYVTLRLSRNISTSTKYLHRLIAMIFIPNPENRPEVNHINGIKTDNSIENLEWVTHSENMNHAFTSQLWMVPDITKRKVYDSCRNMIFDSIKDASEYYAINHSTLRNRLRRRSKKRGCLNYL